MIQVTAVPELARLLHQSGGSQQVPPAQHLPFAQLFDWLNHTQSRLEPVFPDSSDAGLLPFFSLAATKPISDAALQQLQTLPGVDGAYRKPDDFPPGLP